MAILSGKRLGPYEILSAIGAGGMGEVYRARDTRLERVVAVKILPDHLSDRVELRERFEREARTIASLNHPHICTPRMLFEGRYEPSLGFANYDVSPDGQRFLMIKGGEQPQAFTQINVVLNWFEELKRRVPTGK